MADTIFFRKLISEILVAWNNNYQDNNDPNDFRGDKITFLPDGEGYLIKDVIKYLEVYKPVSLLYELLNDDASKELLVSLMAYWALGNTKIKLPVSYERYYQTIEDATALKLSGDANRILKSGRYELARYDLSAIDVPILINASAAGIASVWYLKQYEYECGNNVCIAEQDDVVIDAGGCWGDTALYFADKVGADGLVLVYEFIPSHINIIKHNLALNEDLLSRVKIIDNAVWSNSGNELYYVDWGPGSRITEDPNQYNYDGKTTTLSIDDMVKEQKLSSVDFIKMDIEGAETFALKGAEKTLLEFHPKLAISIYHSLSDVSEIPKYIDSLGLDYSYHIDHYTLFENETVLYAIPLNRTTKTKKNSSLN